MRLVLAVLILLVPVSAAQAGAAEAPGTKRPDDINACCPSRAGDLPVQPIGTGGASSRPAGKPAKVTLTPRW